MASAWFPQVLRVYLRSFEYYELLHCFATEEFTLCRSIPSIFTAQWHTSAPTIQRTCWHQWFDCSEQTHRELLPYNSTRRVASPCVQNINIAKLLTHPNIYIYIYRERVSLPTIVEDNLKAPFLIARCRGGRYSFPRIGSPTLDPCLIMLSLKQGGIKYHFLVWLDLGLNPSLLDLWETP